MYLYIIKREFEEIPFDKTKFTINVHGKLFDVVEGRRNTPLERVADYVVDLSHKVFEKSSKREEYKIQQELEKKYGKFNTLLTEG